MSASKKLWETSFRFTVSGVPDIPIPEDFDKQALGDFFVSLPIGKVGTESRNGRAYNRNSYESMVNTLNQERPLGWWGHSDDDQRSTMTPAVRWLGAAIGEDGIVWGKLVPLTSDAERFFQIAMATHSVVGNSLYGEGKYEADGKTVKDLRVHYIDILANGSWVGVPETAGLVHITSESFLTESEKSTMPFSEAEITKFAADSAKLATIEAAVVAQFGGKDITEALANAEKSASDAIGSYIGTEVSKRVKVESMRPIVIGLIQTRPKTTAEADDAIKKVLENPFVIEAIKASTPKGFGGNMQGEAKDANKGSGDVADDWREAAIKNAKENAKRLGA